MRNILYKFVVAALLVCPLFVGAQSLPVMVGFEDGDLPSGWNKFSANIENESNMGVSSDAAKTGNYGFQFSSYDGADNEDYTQLLVSPQLGDGSRPLEVSFWYRNSEENTDEQFAVGYSATSDIATFSFGSLTVTSDAEWHIYSTVLPAGSKFFAIRYTADHDCYYLYIDDIDISAQPNCARISALSATTVTTSSVTLNWSDTTNSGATYTVRNATTNAVVASNLSATTYTVTGLAASTSYTFSVAAHCTNGEDSRPVSLSVSTACGIISSFPYSYGFETDLGCWRSFSANTENEGDLDRFGSAARTDNYGFQFSSYSAPENDDYTQLLVSPQIGDGSHQLEVSFWYRNSEEDVAETFLLGYSASPDIATFTFGSPVVADANDWRLFTTTLPVGARYICIRYTSTRDLYYLHIDDILIDQLPSCAAVSNLSVDSVTTNLVMLSWIDTTNSGATYTIRNASTNAVIASNFSGTSYTISGLSPSSNYSFSVAANCSNSESSRPATVSVRTSCGDVTAYPYSEGFENGFGCWFSVNGNTTDGFPWTDTVGNDSYGLPHSGNAMAVSFSYEEESGQSIEPDAWLISPHFLLPQADTILLSYWLGSFSSYAAEHLSVYISTTGSDTANFTTAVDSTDLDDGDWAQRTVNLSAYAGQSVYLAFRHHDCYDQWWLMLDDIRIETRGQSAPPTPAPTFYTVSVNYDHSRGTVSGDSTYADSSTVTLSATPAPGYRFAGWQNGTDINTANPYSFTIRSNMTFTALFEPESAPTPTFYTVSVSYDRSMGTVSGDSTYADGATVVLTAVPAPGYHFVHWVDGSSSISNNPYSFTIHSNVSISALFEADGGGTTDFYTVNVTYDRSMGTVSGDSTYADGATVVLTAVPAEGFRFVGWIDGDNTVSYNPYIFVIHANKLISALFESTAGIAAAEADGFSVRISAGRVAVEGAGMRRVLLFDVSGRQVANVEGSSASAGIAVPATGFYLLKVGDAPARRLFVVR